MTRRMWDAAWPPATPPPWEVAAGYIGGNTPHVWTDAEWERQPARWRLPIFTRSHHGIPAADAAQAVAWLGAHGVPKGCTLALDFETRVDATYLGAFDQAVIAAGWRVMVYGSRGTVFRNPKPSGGYWDADWPGPGETAHPHLNAGSAATQWSGSGPFGGAYDPSLVADSTPLWDVTGEDTMSGPASWTDADWKTFWSQIPPSKDPEKGRALNLAELCGYWPDGGIKGVRNDTKAIRTAVAPLADDEANLKAAIEASKFDVSALATALAEDLHDMGLPVTVAQEDMERAVTNVLNRARINVAPAG